MRGTWYYDGSWIPLEIEHSKVIEEVHLKLFPKQSLEYYRSMPETNASSYSYKGIQFSRIHVNTHARTHTRHIT